MRNTFYISLLIILFACESTFESDLMNNYSKDRQIYLSEVLLKIKQTDSNINFPNNAILINTGYDTIAITSFCNSYCLCEIDGENRKTILDSLNNKNWVIYSPTNKSILIKVDSIINRDNSPKVWLFLAIDKRDLKDANILNLRLDNINTKEYVYSLVYKKNKAKAYRYRAIKEPDGKAVIIKHSNQARWQYSGAPVLDSKGSLVGMLPDADNSDVMFTIKSLIDYFKQYNIMYKSQ